MKRIAVSDVFGDGTRNYKIEGYKSKTVGEFIDEVLREYPNEWGYFAIDASFVFAKDVCEYECGKTTNFSDASILDRKIDSIDASGGWSRMDYEIYCKKS